MVSNSQSLVLLQQLHSLCLSLHVLQPEASCSRRLVGSWEALQKFMTDKLTSSSSFFTVSNRSLTLILFQTRIVTIALYQ